MPAGSGHLFPLAERKWLCLLVRILGLFTCGALLQSAVGSLPNTARLRIAAREL